MAVLAEEVATFLIMEKEGCDYQTATGLAFGQNRPLKTNYYHKWYKLLPEKVRVSSKTDVQAREDIEKKVKAFMENCTPDPIHFNDVSWPCDGTAPARYGCPHDVGRRERKPAIGDELKN